MPFSRTSTYQNSFFPVAMETWNNLDTSLINSPSVSFLKKKLYTKPTSTTHNFFKYSLPRKLNIILTQIRNNASNLNGDKFKDHLIENSSCECGFVNENAHHFFFDCPLYNNHRHILIPISNICNIVSVKLLVHGDVNLSDDNNTFILDSVSNYINLSNRF